MLKQEKRCLIRFISACILAVWMISGTGSAVLCSYVQASDDGRADPEELIGAQAEVSPPEIQIQDGMVTMDAAEGAKIFYTQDGRDPETDGILYVEPFPVNTSEGTIQAVAVIDGYVSLTSEKGYRTPFALGTKTNFGGSACDEFLSVAAGEDGYVAVGYSKTGGFRDGDWTGSTGRGNDDASIVKYDKKGNILWRHNFGGGGADRFTAVAAATDGYVAAGYSSKESFGTGDWVGTAGKGGTEDAIIVKYDRDGNVVWKSNLGGRKSDRFHGIAACGDGFVAVGGASVEKGWITEIPIIAKFSRNGELVWEKNDIDSLLYERFYSVAEAKDGYVAAGLFGSTNNGLSQDALFVKYDKSGNRVWTKRFGKYRLLEFKSVAASEDGYAAVGNCEDYCFESGDLADLTGKGSYDAIIVKYDLSGNVEWKRNFGDKGRDEFDCVASVEDGFVAVGSSETDDVGVGDWRQEDVNGGKDAIIVKYDASGNIEWKHCFGGSDTDGYSGVATSGTDAAAVGSSGKSSFQSGDWADTSGKGDTDGAFIKYCDLPKEAVPDMDITPKRGTVSLSGKDTLTRGEELTVPVYFSPDTDAAAVHLALSFPDCLDYVGKTDQDGQVVLSQGEGALELTCYFNPCLKRADSCILTNLRFKVKETCEYSSYGMEYVRTECFVQDQDGQQIAFDRFEDHTFSVTPRLPRGIFILGGHTVSGPVQYTTAFFPGNTEDTLVKWSVSDEETASIDENGYFVPRKNGRVTITACNEAAGVSDSLEVEITGMGTYLDMLSSDVGTFEKDYASTELERVLTVPEGIREVGLTATFTRGSLTIDGQIAGNGRTKKIALDTLPKTVTLIKKETGYTDTTYKVIIQKAGQPVRTPEATPNIQINYMEETLTGFEEGAAYTINGKEVYPENGKLLIGPDQIGTDLSVIKKSSGDAFDDSLPQVLCLPERPGKPEGISAVSETEAGKNDGQISGVDSSMEYRKAGETAWTPCGEGTIMGVGAGMYQIRVQAAAGSFSGNVLELHLRSGEDEPIPWETPDIRIDYLNETLTGFDSGGTYEINGEELAAPNTTLPITEAMPGTVLSIIRKGSGDMFLDSQPQVLYVRSRPEKPEGLVGTSETGDGKKDGQITGTARNMEYRKNTSGTWIACGGNSVTGLENGTYQIRYRATVLSLSSMAAEVILKPEGGEDPPTQAPTETPTPSSAPANRHKRPEIRIDFAKEKLTGFEKNAAYAINGADILLENGELTIGSSMLGTTLSIVRIGDGKAMVDSSAQTLSIPRRPARPAGVRGTAETVAGANDGTLTGVSSAMEYRNAYASTWKTCIGTQEKNLEPGDYQVRFRATETSFASAITDIAVASGMAKPENPENPGIKVSKITITGGLRQIAAGKKTALKAEAKPYYADNRKITWSSSSPTYASVNSRGVVSTRKMAGGKTVTITASAVDGSGTKSSVRIRIRKDSVKKVTIRNAPRSLKAGKSITLRAAVKVTGKDVQKALKWKTSNSKYAAVSASGKVTAKKAGRGKKVTITVTSQDGTNKKASIRIKIK